MVSRLQSGITKYLPCLVGTTRTHPIQFKVARPYHFHPKMSGESPKSDTQPNNTISLSDFDAVGVDLDHTLCKYRLDTTFSLIYKSLAEAVVNQKGYSKELLKPFHEHRDFCTKGLVFDAKKGNFLKLSREGDILRASHGTVRMSQEEVCEVYGNPGKWEHFDFLKDTVQQSAGSFRYFENYFDMPGCVVCARLVDIIDKEAGKRQEEYAFWPSVMECFMIVYQRENFAANLGGYFPTYKLNPPEYVVHCSDSVKAWLKRLRAAGKVTFLLTSSHADYAESLLENVLGKEWREYFSVCMMYARKPGYFIKPESERPFYNIVDNKEGEVVAEMATGGEYLQGSVHTFHNYLKKVTGKDNPKVAYFGDSVRSDILPPSSAGWAPFLILEEMEAEGLTDELNGDGSTEGQNYQQENGGPPAKKTKIMLPSTIEKEFITSSQWGSFFTDQTHLDHLPPDTTHTDDDGPEEKYHSLNTLWGYFIETYAKVAIPQLDYIADLPLDHKFNTFATEAHPTAGFFPHPPDSLKK